MADKEEQNGPGPKMGPKKEQEPTYDTWSGDTADDPMPEPPDQSDDRLLQMRHADELADNERTTISPETADFFEPLDAGRGEDARRAEGE